VCACSCKPAYESSLTDAQWAVVKPLLPVRDRRRGGRRLVYERRLVIDTVLYVLMTGCAWRLVPHDLAPWDVAYRWLAKWTRDGVWDQVHDVLRDRVREAGGRDRQPSAAVLDSQSAKSSEGGHAIGYDAGKRVRGRKRHLLVDTCGLLLRAVVHSASVQDRAGAKLVLAGISTLFPLLGLVWVDGGYVNVVDASLIGWAREQGEPGQRRGAPQRRRERVPGAAPPVGGGTDLRLADEVQTVGTRLRTQDHPRRGHDQGGDDPADGRPPRR
jgi:transposase